MRKLFLGYLLFLVFSSAAQNKNYFVDYKDLANQMEEKYQIPSCVILAVGYIESGGGVSVVGKKLNNHFGIVGASKPEISKHKSRYKYYPTVADSFVGFCELVASKKFYPELRGSADHNKWIKSIAATGYAADAKKWSTTVIGMLNKHCKP
jgi:flagellum-specific peptidoglycan hydrolase FlgJ